MIDFLNTKNYDKMMYNISTRAGGSMLNMYSFELKEKSQETRQKYKDNLWLIPYNSLNNIKEVSRISKKTFNALAYTLEIKREESNDLAVYINNKKLEKDIEILFGQHYVPYKNIDLFSKHNYELDVSISGKDMINSNSSNLYILKKTEDSFKDLLQRNNKTTSLDFSITPFPLSESFFIGINSLMKTMSESYITDLLTIKSIDFIKVSDTCFNWIQLENNSVLDKTHRLDKTLLVDYKLVLKYEDILQWINTNFSGARFEDVLEIFNTDKLELNLVLHPPISTSMQFSYSPVIISPSKGFKYKIEETVVIRVPKSIVLKSQKLVFLDFKFEQDMYSFNTNDNPELFTILDSTGTKNLSSIDFENSIFEPLSTIDFDSNFFRLVFKIPLEVLNQISLDNKYEIKVSISDLTSNRK